MAKVAIKSEKISPFGGLFSIMEQFDSKLSSVIDSTLGMRCRLYGYQYSEIIRSYKYRRFLAMAMPEQVEHRLSLPPAPHHSWSKYHSAFGLSSVGSSGL